MRKREDIPFVFIRLMEPFRLCPIVCMWIFHIPYVFILRSSAAEAILTNNAQIEKSYVYTLLHPWLGRGLLTGSGEKWRAHRKLLTPSFHFCILENFMPVFNEQSEILVSKLMAKAGKGRFDIYPYVTLCTLDIICDSAMGKRIDAQLNKNPEYVKALSLMTEIVMERTLKIWLLIPWIFALSSYGRLQKRCLETLHSFTKKVIQERRIERETNKKLNEINENKITTDNCNYIYGRKHRTAFLDTLLDASDNGHKLTDEEIREEVDTFMFEGHDTTAVGISWILYILGWCPSVQKKVHEELDDIFGDSDRPIRFDDLPKLKYLEGTIKETFRVIPPIPLYGRRLTEEIEITGYKIPAGAEIVISPAMVQSDRELFENPNFFDPMRFFNEDWQKRNPYSYIPFSAGPRNCIGQKFAMMEEKVVLANILRKFEVSTYNNIHSVRAVGNLVFRPINGMYLGLEKRTCHKKS